MRKGDGGETRKKGGRGGIKKMKMFLVATNVIASQPPERQPTGMLTACAKIMMEIVATNVIASQPPEQRQSAIMNACATIMQKSIVLFLILMCNCN